VNRFVRLLALLLGTIVLNGCAGGSSEWARSLPHQQICHTTYYTGESTTICH
jgi:hypothetical protein